MPDLRLGVLGALEVHVDGQLREIPAGRQRAVLSCLLAHDGHPVSADALIEAAWGAELPDNPPKALRTVLSRLRSHLGRDAIELGPAGYRLTVDAVDADEFVELLERAGSLDAAQAGGLLGRALALWRGPAFGEYAEAPCARPLAQHLEQLRMDAIEAHASAQLQTGEPGAAVAGLELLLADQPFREHAVELLATALYHAGRQTEALQRLRDYRAVLAAELGLDPAPDLAALEGRILGHTLPPAGAMGSGESPGSGGLGLPHWLDTSTAFIGREDELADLVAAVARNQVTVVTGPGGVGKSRLVAEALSALQAEVGGPISVTELATVRSGGAAAAVADTLGLRPDAASVTDDLVEFLTAVPHLLVLDNCEHLLDEVGPIVTTVTRRCRDVRVLATSRRRLGVGAELQVPLGPLRLPEQGATTGVQGSAASVRLFGDRVRRLRPSFALTADNTAEVVELCRRCDGLPLALELAASRTATSGTAEVLDRLGADLAQDEPGGLGAVVAWSARLLEPEQRELLDCLSVFAADFSGESVRGVVVHLDSWSGDATSALAELVESSLVAHHLSGSGSRHRLLEMVRVFAARSLAESGREQEVRAAHAAWVRDVVTGIRADWSRVDGAEVSERLGRCSAEVVGALRWALDADALALASDITQAVGRCWHWTPGLALRDLMIEVGERGLLTAGPDVAAGVATGAFCTGERGDLVRAHSLGKAALEMSRDPDSTAIAQVALAVAAMYSGDLDTSAHWFRAVSTRPELIGEGNTSLALLACYRDDLASARDHAAVALAAGPSSGDHSHAFARYAAGEVEARTDVARGAELLAEAAAEADRVDAEQVSRVSRIALFALLVRDRRPADAMPLGLRLCADLRRVGAWTQVWTLLRMLAELLTDHGRWSDAAFFLGAAQAAASAPPPVGADIERYAVLRARLSDHLGAGVLGQIEALAAGTARAQVLSRAERVLADLASQA
ncbi:BTAD domain-containing putative transcriptional regulator [Ornithinimicrobium cryptoxanthini]|uniref:Winged helix-turn-helix domain-containing protein n=1 Tax=Ornithinimicrobium cryptoxanthini TaxID=2934161 RepID=A0ABY4YKU2_9MICO|nr:BTAD domain-containing putative transcriptional regulator [Ornithinimicrobium cryptoxanthini]USQ77428.1 winged helix-turn-helix domain-containing protein [Ornithinimicrobium cryptoxanthini]